MTTRPRLGGRSPLTMVESDLPTAYQILPHEGFASGVVKPRQLPFRTSQDKAPHTPRLHQPDEWTEQAKCLGEHEKYDADRWVRPKTAAALCEGCPVLTDCLETVMEDEEGRSAKRRFGIRGGMTPQQRYELATGGRFAWCETHQIDKVQRIVHGVFNGYRCQMCDAAARRKRYLRKEKTA